VVADVGHHNNMGYRKSKKDSLEKRDWKKFCDENKTLIHRTGLPLNYLESFDLFNDFLMHGYIDHHSVKEDFSTDDMNPDQIKSFKDLLWKYFEAGFDNPGIGVFDYDFAKKLKECFPKQFTYK
jgi:hypothetical protein